MILQALKEYYDRKVADGSLPQEGWIASGIDFLLDLDPDGNLVDIEDMRTIEGKKKISYSINLPSIGKQSLKHTNSGKDANLLWDNAAFVFGQEKNGDDRLQSMIGAIDAWLGDTDDIGVLAVRRFLEQGLQDRSHFDYALNHAEYGELLKEGNAKMSFRIRETGHNVVFESPVVGNALDNASNREDKNTVYGTCMVSGAENVPIETTHPVTKGVWGAQSSGACIVSFNKSAFNSFGKSQSLNAPVSKTVVSQYGKALNALLSSPRQCIHVGDASIVFWSEKASSFEDDFSFYFKEPEKDNPDAGTEKIKALYESLHSGAFVEEQSGHRFYILGLAPNAARISIRFWQVGTVAEIGGRIAKYFDEFAIVKSPKEPEYYSIWRILVNIATQDKSENIPPNIAGDFMRAILAGTPYPATLLQACLRRIHSDAENRVKPVRAALIKAYLNRFYANSNNEEVKKELEKNNPSTGFQLGRMFAVLEKIQEEANPGINVTIRERFYGAACATPVSVFPNLLRLKNHHLAKMVNRGRVINFEQLLGEIMTHLTDFPAHLGLHEQGLFAIGYYQQRQDFFKPKKDVAENN